MAGQVVWAQLTVSSLAFVLAVLLLFRLVSVEFDALTARAAVLLIALSPFAFFLLAPYSEALFLALSIAMFLFLRQERWWLGGLAASAAALTRPFGILLILPLALAYYERQRRRGWSFSPKIVAVALPALALAALQLWDRVVIGETRSLLEVDRSWGVALKAPWDLLAASLHAIVGKGDLVSS